MTGVIYLTSKQCEIVHIVSKMRMGDLPVPPQDSSVDRLLSAQATRRTINRALGAVLTVTGMYEGDQLVTDLIWSDNKLQLLPLRECVEMCQDSDWRADSILVGGPGTGHKSGERVTQTIADATERSPARSELSLYVKLPDSGLTKDTYPSLLGALIGRCDSMDVGGESASGVFQLDAARRLKRQGHGVLRFGRVDLIGTPRRLEDVREEHLAELVAKLGYLYPGSLAGSYIADIVDAIKIERRRFFTDMYGGLMRAFRRTLSSDSPHIEMTGVNLLFSTNLIADRNDFAGIIDEDTEFHFFGADNDRVVNASTAKEGWGNFAADLGAKFFEHWAPSGTGHADIFQVGESLRSWQARQAKTPG